MPTNTIKVARPGMWGNPFSVEVFGRELAIDLFRNSAFGYWNPELVKDLPDQKALIAYQAHEEWRKRMPCHPVEAARSFLRGKNLACFCKPEETCHADILLKAANS